MKSRQIILIVMNIGLLSWPFSGHPEEWPTWRGPYQNGSSAELNLPAKWSKTQNIKWRVSLPGPAASTPVVWKDRVFLTSADGDDNLLLICTTGVGGVAWTRILDDSNVVFRQGESNNAAPSPCTDGNLIWTYFGTGMLACYDFEGKEIWKVDVGQRYGEIQIEHGMSNSPALFGDLLCLLLVHDNAQLVIALEKRTGKEVWQSARTGLAEPGERWRCYASPIAFYSDTGKALITHALAYTVGHDVTNGNELWRVKMNFGEDYDSPYRFIGTPAVSGDMVVVTSAKNGPVYCIAAGDLQGNAGSRITWIQEHSSTDITSPLINDGLVYLCWENGRLLVLDLYSGEEVYRQRTLQGNFRSSPVYGDGKVYLTSRDGSVVVVKAGRHFEVLAENDFGEVISASPAIANGTIYFRTYDALYAIAELD